MLGWGGIREDVSFAGNLDIYEFKILDETCIGSKKSRMCVSIESWCSCSISESDRCISRLASASSNRIIIDDTIL